MFFLACSAPQSPNNQQTPTGKSKGKSTRQRKQSTGAALLHSKLLEPNSQFTTHIKPGPSSQAQKWETLVLFSVNLSELEVKINMGNVMGNTE